MKIILDNIIFSLQKSGGISVYWYELLQRLLTNKSQHPFEVQIYQNKTANQNLFASQLQQRLNYSSLKESNLPLSILRYLDFKRLKLTNNDAAQVIFHSSYYRHAPDKINIVTIHDFTYEFYRHGLAQKIHTWQKSRAITKASGIICISESTKKDLLNFYPNLDVPITIINQGKSDDFYVLDKTISFSPSVEFLAEQKFYLYVGDRRNYKNFYALVEQLRKDQILVIVGGGLLSDKEKQHLQQNVNNYYHFLRPDNAVLNELYNLAYALLYPSAYEGFGIPLIEAMAAGCPVVCQHVSSLTEVAGDAGIFFDLPIMGEQQGGLQDSLNLLEDEKFYQTTIVKGLKNASLYSWDKCYQQTLDFYASFSASS